MLMMRPAPSAIMWRTTYLVRMTGESTLRRSKASISEVCIVPGQLSGRCDIERGDEFYDGRHLVGRQRRLAIRQYPGADFIAPAGIDVVGQNDVGNHYAAGDRTAARLGAGHPHFRLPVDDRFD